MEIISDYITIVTFIPWVLIFVLSAIYNINNEDYINFSGKYLKKNFFKIFRLDVLFLVGVFFYFASFKKVFVDKYLFPVICIYLFVNYFYENKKSIKKSFWKQNKLELLLLFIVILIPFLVYFKLNNLGLTYKIMLLYLFLEYIIIVVIKKIATLIKRRFTKL